MDRDALENILALIPKGTPIKDVKYTYILVTLKRHYGNRTKTCADIHMCVRALRSQFKFLVAAGYTIPRYEPYYERGVPK